MVSICRQSFATSYCEKVYVHLFQITEGHQSKIIEWLMQMKYGTSYDCGENNKAEKKTTNGQWSSLKDLKLSSPRQRGDGV